MIIPAGFAQVSIPFRKPGLQREQFVVFGVDPDPGLSTPVAIADAVLDAWAMTMQEDQDNSVEIGPVLCTLGTVGGPLTGEGLDTGGGGSAFNVAPPNIACLVKKITATPGRKGRGRMYVPWFLPDEAIDETGVIDSTSLAVRQADVAALLLDLESRGVPMVLLHNDSTAPSPVLALQVDSLIATQRRRLRK